LPKIEISRADLASLLGAEVEEGAGSIRKPLLKLKAELESCGGDALKIELKDTNRPDLWCVEGVARGLRAIRTGRMDHLADLPPAGRELVVDESVSGIRPWIAAFAAGGPPLSALAVEALIASQEKLAGSFGRNRKTAAIGFYRLSGLTFPVTYAAVAPTTVFHPLGKERPMSLDEVLERTEVGRRYAPLLDGAAGYPLLKDSAGMVLSFPPVLNAEETGRISEGDSEIFCEVTGTDWHTVQLTAVILACNLEDRGFSIEPVRIIYPGSSPGGEEVCSPVPYADTLTAGFDLISSITGCPADPDAISDALSSMDYTSWLTGPNEVRAVLPPYRHDGMHPVDLVEDIAVARGFDAYPPLMPPDFTVGAPAPEEETSDALRTIMTGLGCEELLLPVLQSRERPGTAPPGAVSIRNPMTAEYSAVRNSLLPGLLGVESASGHSSYPHRLFEVGEVLLDEGGRLLTEIRLACTVFGNEAFFGDAHSILGAICSQRSARLSLRPAEDLRFVPGRCAEIMIEERPCGMIGELAPSLLTAAGIARPGSAFEVELAAFAIR